MSVITHQVDKVGKDIPGSWNDMAQRDKIPAYVLVLGNTLVVLEPRSEGCLGSKEQVEGLEGGRGLPTMCFHCPF